MAQRCKPGLEGFFKFKRNFDEFLVSKSESEANHKKVKRQSSVLSPWSSEQIRKHCILIVGIPKTMFLAVQNSSIGDLVTHWLTHRTLLIVIQRATLDTCDLWDIWSEWLGDMTWPKKRQRQWQIQRQRQWQRQIHLESTLKEQSHRLLTFETFDQVDEETWPDPKKRQWQWQIQIQRQWQRQIHLESNLKERSQRLVTFETSDPSDEQPWPTKRQRQRQIQ